MKAPATRLGAGGYLLTLVIVSLSIGVAVAGAAQAIPWQPTGLSGGGGMFTPAISPADPDLLMLNCDMGAAYLSDDGGHHWRMVPQAQLRSDTRCRPAFHPTDPNTLFASSGGRLCVSHDRGKTFSPIGDWRDAPAGEIAINPADPNAMLAGKRLGGCVRSKDAGRTWLACDGPVGEVISFHFDRTRQGLTLFVATDRGIWRSEDGGAAWGEHTQGLPWKEIQGFAAGSDPVTGTVMLYCTVQSKETEGAFAGGIYRSRDRGETWQSAMGSGLNVNSKRPTRMPTARSHNTKICWWRTPSR